MNGRHDVAFGGDHFEGVTGGRLRAISRSAAAATSAPRAEGGFELFVVGDLIVFSAFLEGRVVLFVARVGQREAVGSLAKELENHFLIRLHLRGCGGASGGGIGRHSRLLSV